ncbi:MAG TPA: ATP-binding protein [Mycobacteriales bacterium]|nr:ATP-binding protein [Mycobacteriales bacterium]
MATLELQIPPLPVHVRTARLVGVAAGRRARLPDDLVDELRLALGEACSRAVALHAEHAPESPVSVLVDDSDGRLTVEVKDFGPPPGSFAVPVHELLRDSPGDPNVALAFLAGLVEDVEVTSDDEGTTVRLSWPLLAAVR